MGFQTLQMREKQLRTLMILTVVGMILTGSCFVEAWIYFQIPFLCISIAGAILSITSIVMIVFKKRAYNEKVAWIHDDLRNEQNEKLIHAYENGLPETKVNDILIYTTQLLDHVQSKKLK